MKELQKLLSKDEFDRFIYNMYFNKHRSWDFKELIVTETQLILSGAFNWKESKEGLNYWIGVYDKLLIYEKTKATTN